jgi:hypothetical protein
LALRHQFSLVLPFGSRAILAGWGHSLSNFSYNFRPSGFASPVFTGFAILGSSAVMTDGSQLF